MKILYLENHQAFAEAVKREFLQEHEIHVAPTIEEAKNVAQNGFDLVMCDYDLDDGKGDEFVAYLRSINFTIPVIAVSSHSRGNSAIMAAGANATCKKIAFRNINNIINSLI